MVLTTSSLFGQNCLIQFNYSTHLKMGYNYFQINLEESMHDSILVTTDNGTIERIGNDYRIVTKKPGYTNISVYDISRNDTVLIESKRCFVKRFGDFTRARICGKDSGLISKSFLRACSCIVAHVENLNTSATLQVVSFKLIVLRNDSLVFTVDQSTGKGWFSDELRKNLEQLQSGDDLYFINIIAKDTDAKEVTLNNIILKIE